MEGLDEGLIPRGFPTDPAGIYTSFGSGGEGFEIDARDGGSRTFTDGCTFRRLSNGTWLVDANAFTEGLGDFMLY
jgi:hypothetical protein